MSVVSRGQELVKKLELLFSQPGDIRAVAYDGFPKMIVNLRQACVTTATVNH